MEQGRVREVIEVKVIKENSYRRFQPNIVFSKVPDESRQQEHNGAAWQILAKY